MMKILNTAQGSDQWKEIRGKYRTASEAPAIMGASSVKKRTDVLRMHATGGEEEYSRFIEEVVFPRGHEVEAAARPLAEELLGDDLLRLTVVNEELGLLASMDGLTDDLENGWECKQWNEEKARVVREHRTVPAGDYWQVIHQLAVGVKRVLYMVTDGTPEKCETVLIEAEEVESNIDLLLRGWAQWIEDLANYQPEEVKVAPVAAVVQTLPAVSISVNGDIAIVNNLEKFGEALSDFLEHRLIKSPQTDQDFADLEAQIKTLKDAEAALDTAEEVMLAQMEPINAVKILKDQLRETTRQNRLASEKLLKAEKENRRTEILSAALADLQSHIDRINETLGGKVYLPTSISISADIAGAMKGKKTISGLKEAANVAITHAKLEASRIGDLMLVNLRTLRDKAAGFEFLFRDAEYLVQKDPEDLAAVITHRISEHKEQQEAREAEIREQAAAAERERLEKEQAEAQQPADQAGSEASQEAADVHPLPAEETTVHDGENSFREPVPLPGTVVRESPKTIERREAVASLRLWGKPMSVEKANAIIDAVIRGDIPGLVYTGS